MAFHCRVCDIDVNCIILVISAHNHTCTTLGNLTYRMQFHYFRIGEEIYIKGNNVALIIQFELCSIRCANL